MAEPSVIDKLGNQYFGKVLDEAIYAIQYYDGRKVPFSEYVENRKEVMKVFLGSTFKYVDSNPSENPCFSLDSSNMINVSLSSCGKEVESKTLAVKHLLEIVIRHTGVEKGASAEIIKAMSSHESSLPIKRDVDGIKELPKYIPEGDYCSSGIEPRKILSITRKKENPLILQLSYLYDPNKIGITGKPLVFDDSDFADGKFTVTRQVSVHYEGIVRDIRTGKLGYGIITDSSGIRKRGVVEKGIGIYPSVKPNGSKYLWYSIDPTYEKGTGYRVYPCKKE